MDQRTAHLGKNNTLELLYPRHDRSVGGLCPINTAVPVAFRYTDSSGKPIANQRLHWRIEAGPAVLELASSVTDVEGVARNRIVVPPTESVDAAAQLSVWPQDEPENRFDAALNFEAAGTLARTVLPNGNILAIVSRRDSYSSSSAYSNSSGLIYTAYYCDSNGNPLEGQEIQFTPDRGTLAPNWPTSRPKTNQAGIAQVGFCNYSGSPGASLTCVAGLPGNPYVAQVSNPITDDSATTYQANMVWPVDPAATYGVDEWIDVKVHFVSPDGSNYYNKTNAWWDITQGEAQFEHEETAIDENGISSNRIKASAPGKVAAQISFAYISPTVLFAYPTFNFAIISKNSLTITSPDAGKMQYANTGVEFQVTYKDADGKGLENKLIDWTVLTQNATFSPSFSRTSAEGVAVSRLTTSPVRAGEKINVTVSAVADALAQDSDTRNYVFGANTLDLIYPDPAVDYPVNLPIPLRALYTDADGGLLVDKQVDWTCDLPGAGTDYLLASPTSRTDRNGYANNYLTAYKPLTLTLTVNADDILADTSRTTAHFVDKSVTYTLSIDAPQAGVALPYDTRVAVNVTLKSTQGGQVGNQTLVWQGDGIEQSTTVTDPSGKSTNYIVVETTGGYPSSATYRPISVSAPAANASQGRVLTFDAPATNNALTFTAPSQNDSLPVNQWVQTGVRLVSALGHPLGNYMVTWKGDDGIQFDEPVTQTLSDGTSTNRLKLNAQTGASADKTVYAEAVKAAASGARALHFGERSSDPFRLITNGAYAHNPPDKQQIDPSNDDQIITVIASVSKNGVPQDNVTVTFEYYPQASQLRFFDADNTPIFPKQKPTELTKYFEIPTKNGNAILKVGALAPFLGYIDAHAPDEDTQTVSIVIASADNSKNDYSVPIVPGGSDVVVPGPGFPTFSARLPYQELQSSPPDTLIAMWLKGAGGRETVFVRTLDIAHAEGIPVPYSLLDMDNENRMAFWAGDLNVGNAGQSEVLKIHATGQRQSSHPDYGSTNRPLPAPYLDGNASAVNQYNISGGLSLNIPPYDGWRPGDEITAYIYLNGYDVTKQIKYNVVPVSHKVVDGDFVNGTPVVLRFQEEDLAGYASAYGIEGTFEADYNVTRDNQQAPYAWSQILDHVILDTVPPL